MTAKERYKEFMKWFEDEPSQIKFKIAGELHDLCEQICAEQRRICMILADYKTENDVDNAPMPEL